MDFTSINQGYASLPSSSFAVRQAHRRFRLATEKRMFSTYGVSL